MTDRDAKKFEWENKVMNRRVVAETIKVPMNEG